MWNRGGRASHRPHAGLIGLALAALLAGAGCGNLTVGGFGEVRVTVSGDAEEDAAPAVAKARLAPAPLATAARNDQPEGELEVELDLFLVSESGATTRLNDDDVRVRVDLRGRQEADIVNRVVEATRYSTLRIVFTEVKAKVESGLVINGVPVLGEVRVESRDTHIEVSRPIHLDVGSDQQVALLIDMNAAAWLAAVNPVTLVVDPAVFASRIGLVVR